MRFCPPKTSYPVWANLKIGGANFKKIGADALKRFLPTLFKNRASAHA